MDRLKWYRVAGLSDETIRYLEWQDGDVMWRRDAREFFGFTNIEAFCERFGERGLGAFNFTQMDVMATFNYILKWGLLAPRRRR
jgi:hypothetical protein